MSHPAAGHTRRISFDTEERIMLGLLVFVLLALISPYLGLPVWLQFFLSVAGVVPLAAFIGAATEALADTVGGRLGGLLNATFGNFPDLLVGIFGVQKGLIPLVKATLVGALISNSALLMGLCYIVAGLAYGRPTFQRREAGHHSVLMMLTVAAILFPSVGAYVLCGGTRCGAAFEPSVLHVSVGVSAVLLVSYLAYVAYGIFGLQRLGKTETGPEERVYEALSEGAGWPAWFALVVLFVAAALLIPVTDILTNAVSDVTTVLGWTEVFVGIIIVANAGNVAEGYAAIKLSLSRAPHPQDSPTGDSGLDLALGIASASSIQIATFVAPIVVLYSLSQHTMDLVFSPVEIAILAVMVIIFAFIVQDGESNWLEGAQLLALYVMAAVVFFALPVSVFS